jgi:DegT/DnrJ/EryC1/StrS aminotransferase family
MYKRNEYGLNYTDGYILNPDVYYSPSYRISPFRTADISFNKELEYKGEYNIFQHKFDERKWGYTSCGKEAINLALASLNLSKEGMISIMTTSGNSYISGCVTREIEKFCRWEVNKVSVDSDAIFVIHEFGYPYRDINKLLDYNLPIIEDACHSLMAGSDNQPVGKVGDFCIYSLPKFFPIQFGGILTVKSKYSKLIEKLYSPNDEEFFYINKVLYQFRNMKLIINKRFENYKIISEIFQKFDCTPYFELKEGDLPSVFLFRFKNRHIDLEKLKQYVWKQGIECSVFYGEDAFFLPLNHRLTKADLHYFGNVINSYLVENNDCR